MMVLKYHWGPPLVALKQNKLELLIGETVFRSHKFITRNKGRQALLMCEVQSCNKCIEFNKEIKTGPIYQRCSHLKLIMWRTDVP